MLLLCSYSLTYPILPNANSSSLSLALPHRNAFFSPSSLPMVLLSPGLSSSGVLILHIFYAPPPLHLLAPFPPLTCPSPITLPMRSSANGPWLSSLCRSRRCRAPSRTPSATHPGRAYDIRVIKARWVSVIALLTSLASECEMQRLDVICNFPVGGHAADPSSI